MKDVKKQFCKECSTYMDDRGTTYKCPVCGYTVNIPVKYRRR